MWQKETCTNQCVYLLLVPKYWGIHDTKLKENGNKDWSFKLGLFGEVKTWLKENGRQNFDEG
jgi:hypothetical protein